MKQLISVILFLIFRVIFLAGTMVMSGGQRLVGPNGQVIVAAPGQQLVRTSGGQLVLQQQAAASPVRPPVSVGGAGRSCHGFS